MKPTLVDLMRAADDLQEVIDNIDFLLDDDNVVALRRVLAILLAYINGENT